MKAAHRFIFALCACAPPLKVRVRSFATAALLFCAVPAVLGQTAGSVDFSFDPGSAVVGTVNVVAPAGNGKVYVGGNFHTVRGAVRYGIARLNPDGTADQTFDPGSGPSDSSVSAVAVQADGMVLIAGYFTSYNGVPRIRVARLFSDGSLDTTFDPASGPNGGVYSIAQQADGKVLIAGVFTQCAGVSRNSIARLNADGSLDASFNPGSGAYGSNSSEIASVAVQPDGKVLIGGSFTIYNGETRNRIARLNSDGSLDSSFNPGSGADQDIRSVVVQADGKVLIGGSFNSYAGVPRKCIARLNSNGSLDTSFNPGTGVTSGLESVAVQADGMVLIAGFFHTYNGTPRSKIARLNTNGSLDTSFNPGTGASDSVLSVAVAADGKVFIGGYFESYNGTGRNSVARLNSDGSLDMSFTPGTGANDLNRSVGLQTDGKVLIGGHFTSYNGTARNYMARLNSDGSLDSSFNPGIGQTPVYSVAVQADGKMLIGYSGLSTTVPPHVARLHINGSLDTSFNPGSGANNEVRAIAMQPDGKALIAGAFTSYNGTGRIFLARINSDGSLDTSFNHGIRQLSDWANSVAVQADGKVLVGLRTNVGQSRILRLNPNGNLDDAFNPGTGPNNQVYCIAVQADGKVLVGGEFTSFNGTPRGRIARLNSNGTLDTTFGAGTGVNNYYVNSIAVQADGKVLIGGGFTSYNGVVLDFLARLDRDGNLDMSFNPGNGLAGRVSAGIASIALQADGGVLIGGTFGSYGGTPRNRLARLTNDPAIQSISVPNGSRVQWLRSGAAPEVEQVSYEHSADGVSWSVLGVGTRMTGGWERADLSLSATGYIRSRGRATGGQLNGSSSVIEQMAFYTFGAGSFAPWAAAAGLTGVDAFPTAAPRGDGVQNLLKYAFNMNGAGPDNCVLVPGSGVSGLPVYAVTNDGTSRFFRFEFLRRIGSGLIYTPRKSTSLSRVSWLPLTSTATVLPIDANWERVIYEETYDPVATPKCFGRVEVALP